MRTHVDWLTFTLRLNLAQSDGDYAQAIQDALLTLLGREILAVMFSEETQPKQRGRAPYPDAWVTKDANGNILQTVYAGIALAHFSVEIGGKGCERLIETGYLQRVLECVHGSVTRIDVACDIETSVAPTEFVKELTHDRMRASGYQRSETGETCYVGSQKSERYARVYRYFEPHPRSHLLRVEHVFRRDQAKVVALACVRDGVDGVGLACAKVFGWGHPVWDKAGVTDTELAFVGAERGGGKTITWLITSVAPAFQRLVREGVIKNPDEFVKRYFFPEQGTHA